MTYLLQHSLIWPAPRDPINSYANPPAMNGLQGSDKGPESTATIQESSRVLYIGEGSEMAKMLDGKVAIVTGGASGIGRAAVLNFAAEGARVVVADVDIDGGEETLRLVQSAVGEASFVRTDVSIAADSESLVRQTIERYGRLDCAFNNAGIAQPVVPIHEMDEQTWDHVLNVNLNGVFHCMKFEIRQMLLTGGGAIVNTSSVAGLTGLSSAAYTVSKHGVIGLTRRAAMEYAHVPIRVNAVCPGVIRTPMVANRFDQTPELEERWDKLHPLGLGTAHQVAQAATWLCSDAASYVTGVAMPVDGGLLAGPDVYRA